MLTQNNSTRDLIEIRFVEIRIISKVKFKCDYNREIFSTNSINRLLSIFKIIVNKKNLSYFE